MGMEHYTKVKDLGGTNGAFLARDRQQPDRLVVIKRLDEGAQGIEELNAALRLRHRNIIRFLESFIHETSLFVVMSYETGGDLEELFRYLAQRHKTPTTHTLLLWFMQLLDALVYCHENHVIHRDIKPSNILVSEDTKVLYLGDFGSAKTLSASNVTSTFVGSPMWVSPEVLLGTSYGYAADVWSMGCVFYEMATLRKPFSAPSFAHLVQEITWGHVIPLPSHVAEEVRSIIYSMLVLDPAQRVTAKAALSVARSALERAEQASRALVSPAIPAPMPPVPAETSSAALPTEAPPGVVVHEPRQHPLPTPAQSHPWSPSCPPADTIVPLMEGADAKGTALPVPTPSHLAKSPCTSALSELPMKLVEAKAGEDPTPQGTPFTAAAVQESVTHVAVVKRRPNSTLSTSSPQATASPPPRAVVSKASLVQPTATPQTPAAKKATLVRRKGGEDKAAPAAEGGGVECEARFPSQQVVLQISTAGFTKPVRAKKVAARKAGTKPQRQRVPGVPAPIVSPIEAPNFMRQLTVDSLAARRAPAVSAVAQTNVPEMHPFSRSNSCSTKVVVKAMPPAHVAKRALAAAANQESPPRVPKQSPTRTARGPFKPQPKQTPTLSSKPTADANTVGAPADQWFDQRMRDLCAMENYLHQHRVDDDKVLQTYDARRHEEGYRHESVAAVRDTRKPSPGPRGDRSANRLTNAAPSPSVLVMTPPRRRPPAEAASAPSALSLAQQQLQLQRQPRPGAVSPLTNQTPYSRQVSNYQRGSNSRQNSLSSTYSGHQASNARARPRASPDEQLKTEKERIEAREKREAERQRMKELIHAQRAAARKEKRKAKRGSALDVEIVLPDHRHYIAKGVVPAD